MKHYLRGEESVYYSDLYHLVKHLPVYVLPAGRPSVAPEQEEECESTPIEDPTSASADDYDEDGKAIIRSRPAARAASSSMSYPPIPILNTTPASPPTSPTGQTGFSTAHDDGNHLSVNDDPSSSSYDAEKGLPPRRTGTAITSNVAGPTKLMPAWNPPKYALFDVFPFSLLVKALVRRGRQVEGKKGAKLRAKEKIVDHNIPLEVTLYLVGMLWNLSGVVDNVDADEGLCPLFRARTFRCCSSARSAMCRPSVSCFRLF